MKRIRFTKEEKKIERDLLAGVYVPVSKKEFEEIAQAIEAKRKDAVLNIRINSRDLAGIKQKAKKLGVKYQTFISEFLHKLAS